MKIAFLNIYQGLVERGGETYVRELSSRLSKNHQVDVISGKKIPPKRWPVIWRWFIDPQGLAIALFTLKNIPRILRRRYDVVIPVNGGWQPAFIRLATWLYGGKMIVSGQSGIGWDDKNNLWSLPNVFVALSTHGLKWAKKYNPFVRSVYIPNGVDLNKFKPEGDKYDSGLKQPIILVVAALVPGKRIDLVIKAVSKLKTVSLLVVGDGELKEQINNLGENLMADRFKQITVAHDDIAKVYREADLFVFVPEKSESFGIVYVEALATGLGVVAIDDLQRREIIKSAGVYVTDPLDSENFKDQISLALNTKWAHRPRKEAARFDWDEIAKNYEELFKGF